MRRGVCEDRVLKPSTIWHQPFNLVESFPVILWMTAGQQDKLVVLVIEMVEDYGLDVVSQFVKGCRRRY